MLPLHEIFLRLGFGRVLGAVIGIERDVPQAARRNAHQPVRAVGLGVVHRSLGGDRAQRRATRRARRIASNLVQGIGFLGAGAILRESGSCVGMTTAATIFVEAAIGMASRRRVVLRRSRIPRACWCFSRWWCWFVDHQLGESEAAHDAVSGYRRATPRDVGCRSAADAFSKLDIKLDNFQVSMAGGDEH